MLRRTVAVTALALILLPNSDAQESDGHVRHLITKKIWDAAPHNAFTDLIRFEGKWYCTFREGSKHVSDDGAIRVIRSSDAQDWESAALITSKEGDLRDPKFSITPDGRLMIVAAIAKHPPEMMRQPLVYFSSDGTTWSTPIHCGEKNFWLWRVTWHCGKAYGVGYACVEKGLAKLYVSPNGRIYQTHVENFFSKGWPTEASIIFLEDGTGVCLMRRDGKTDNSAYLGTARPPYTEWEWKDLGVRIGGPHLLQLPDGRIIAAGRLYDDKVRTSLMWLDHKAAKVTEIMALRSGGDTSYPGLGFENGTLLVSYYSSHEGKTSIYLSKLLTR